MAKDRVFRWVKKALRLPKGVKLAERPEAILDLSAYQGNWVAIKGGRVIASAPGTRALIDIVVAMGAVARGSTLMYEPRPEEVKKWAVVDRSDPQYVCPNCLFSTKDQAMAWLNAWRGDGSDRYVATRADYHSPWTEFVSPS